ncbi:hypothetical protein IU427_27275 [Nocardia beijingensis]|uniref:hypothetical protein n=1 Tax=Nocardia beijingensis TaxID=95162 RepID=UPI0018950CDF|nr:hypothetical protein [Nocardia beijingensis]MBF6468837.1 hypothetical protein [Nocardia beijingensis]
MNDRKSADKATADAPGTAAVPSGIGRPSQDAADVVSDATGSSGNPAPTADTPGADRGDVTGIPGAAQVPEDAAVQASGAYGGAPEPETVTSEQDPRDAVAESHGGGAGDESEAVGSAQARETAAAEAGTAAGKPETVSSRPDDAAESAAAGGKTETVTSAQISDDAAAEFGGAAGTGGKAETVTSAQATESAAAEAASADAGGKPETSAEGQAGGGGMPGGLAGAAGTTEPGSTARLSAADAARRETPISESVRRAAERAEQIEADAAAAAERGAAGIPRPVARPGRTLLETLRDKPILAAIPASTLAFILWRAFRQR